MPISRNGHQQGGGRPPRKSTSLRAKAKGGATGVKGSAGFKMTIASDHAAVREVQRRIMDAVHASAFGPESQFAIKLALEEAMINAVKHGNRLNPSKKVHVAFNITPSQAEITVEDEGEGFDPNEVPDPTLEENLCKCSGRGILLMRAYMSKVQFSRGGRRLKMVRKNAG